MEPPRGFSVEEFETRTAAVQAEMAAAEIDALLLTTEPEVRYFSGFLSQFWESPTRPWFLVVPAAGKPIAVVPEIGAAGFVATWLDDIRTWPAPRPEDDGISLLAELLKPCRRLGVQLGHESHLRMPMGDFANLGEQITQTEITDATDILRRQMVVKSDAEIAKIRHACQIASEGFIALPDKATMGDSERDVCRKLRLDIIARGADSVPYMVAGSGPGGYDNIIMGPTDRVPDPGDILIIDTGARYDGYFCDFDRNFAFG
ncbi:MAG: aminopeptidase P family protein, partial [Rhodospirillaceae bacterium]|nr:aminopeptidase P family protein [Rhodospirillaceae bacterium]